MYHRSLLASTLHFCFWPGSRWPTFPIPIKFQSRRGTLRPMRFPDSNHFAADLTGNLESIIGSFELRSHDSNRININDRHAPVFCIFSFSKAALIRSSQSLYADWALLVYFIWRSVRFCLSTVVIRHCRFSYHVQKDKISIPHKYRRKHMNDAFSLQMPY